MKTAVLTGGTGFLGYWLLKELIENNVFVYVVVRKNTRRHARLSGIQGIEVIELDMDEISELSSHLGYADVFYHFAWEGGRNDFASQLRNVNQAVNAIQAAHNIGAKKFIMPGSQAEYGIYDQKVDENSPTNPNTAYGACKVACYNILRTLSEQLCLPLTWVRIFSVYGEWDNPNTLISYLFRCFNENVVPKLTSGEQQWDFLYAKDAASALYLLGKTNKNGIFNLAYGENRPLRDFIMEARDLINPGAELSFDLHQTPNTVELRANIDKIKMELGWEPKINFRNGILKMINHQE